MDFWLGPILEELMTRAAVGLVLGLTLTAPGFAGDTPKKPKKPSLELRVIPRTAFSPVTAFFTAELTGGDEVEELYCPEVLWEWGDGGKSVQEADCDPFEAGKTKIQRRYTAEHEFRRAGSYQVKVALRRSERTVAAASVHLSVRPGLGDRSEGPGS